MSIYHNLCILYCLSLRTPWIGNCAHSISSPAAKLKVLPLQPRKLVTTSRAMEKDEVGIQLISVITSSKPSLTSHCRRRCLCVTALRHNCNRLFNAMQRSSARGKIRLVQQSVSFVDSKQEDDGCYYNDNRRTGMENANQADPMSHIHQQATTCC